MVDGLQINVKSIDDLPVVEKSIVELLEKYGKLIVNVVDARPVPIENLIVLHRQERMP